MPPLQEQRKIQGGTKQHNKKSSFVKFFRISVFLLVVLFFLLGTPAPTPTQPITQTNQNLATAPSTTHTDHLPRSHYPHWKTRQELGIDNRKANSNGGAHVDGPIAVANATIAAFKIHPKDYAYRQSTWDSSPIVLPEYKLVFFTVPKVGCSGFKRLFRRMMGLTFVDDPGLSDKKQQELHISEHNPHTNGLKYLSHYPPEKAEEFMTSPDWTRAIFLRDPKERVLSAYLDKGLHNNGKYLREHCCGTQQCGDTASASFAGFLQVIHSCNDSHWAPFVQRMEAKYWSTINFVGHMSEIRDDTQKLLQRLPPGNVWEKYGATGWGQYHNETIFASGKAIPHKTGAKSKLLKYYDPETEVMADELYWMDYRTNFFGFDYVKLYPNSNNSAI